MAEEKYKVQTYEIDFKCDICGKGWYRPTGEILTTKVASFNNEEAAVWFADIFEDFLEIPSDKRGVNK